MSCHTVAPELVAYHFGTLDPETRQAVEDHLPVCGSCLREFIALKRALETSEEGPLPSAQARERLRLAVARELRPRATSRTWSRWERPLAWRRTAREAPDIHYSPCCSMIRASISLPTAAISGSASSESCFAVPRKMDQGRERSARAPARRMLGSSILRKAVRTPAEAASYSSISAATSKATFCRSSSEPWASSASACLSRSSRAQTGRAADNCFTSAPSFFPRTER
ncbi:zf-HC2 domain-containing protein [Corallococcus sp. NCSPR001]|nr:zf-HC2 domain-containing protein [Corallococcus sp. NCSPR001]